MKKMAKEVSGLIKLQIKGGQQTLLPCRTCIRSKGVNIMEFCKQFNARTQDNREKLFL